MCCFVILLFRYMDDIEVVDFDSSDADIGHINTNHATNIINIDLMAMNMLQGMFFTIGWHEKMLLLLIACDLIPD